MRFLLEKVESSSQPFAVLGMNTSDVEAVLQADTFDKYRCNIAERIEYHLKCLEVASYLTFHVCSNPTVVLTFVRDLVCLPQFRDISSYFVTSSSKTHKEKSQMSDKKGSPPKSTEGRVFDNDYPSFGEPSYTNTQEALPSYEHEPSPPLKLQSTSTAASLRAPRIPSEHATQISSTTSQFPPTIPPPYTPSHPSHQVLFAIPQTNPTPTSPLLLAYPSTLSTHGITLSTWSTFLAQISTHLSARTTSKRLLSHASDVAVSVPRKLGKNLIHTGTAAKENLSHSAKQLNPFGVVNSVVGFTFGVTGALVGGLVGVPGTILAAKPRTQMERVGEFLEERNKGWLHERGLHAEVVGMGELSGRVGRTVAEILGVAGMGREGDAQGADG